MNNDFNQQFEKLNALDHVSDNLIKQQRGHKFEDLINDVFAFEQTLLRKGYHTSDQSSEQIDGAIEIWNRILLVEVKWVESNIAASELFSFIGKIDNKFHGTLGVFISRNELTDNFINALNRGRRQNVIVIHGEDVDLLFQPDSAPLSDYIAHCLKLLSYDNLTHFPYSEFLKVYKSPAVLAMNRLQQESSFISNYLDRTDEVSEEELALGYSALTHELRRSILMYLLWNLEMVWLSESKNHYSERKYNYLRYFNLLSPDSSEISGTEAIYFRDRLPASFGLYGAPEIFDLYVDKFTILDLDVKVNFERKLVSELREAGKFNSWQKETVMTGIIEKLWDSLEVVTRRHLKELYIYIELDNFRNSQSPQKLFANNLLAKGIISTDELQDWLGEKLKDFIRSVGNYGDMKNFFYSTYFGIAKYLGLDQISFVQMMDEKAKEIIASNG